MSRSEILLTGILVLLILAGTAYQTYRGGPKTAEIIITHPSNTPFDATPQMVPTIPNIAITPTAQPTQNRFTQAILHFFNTASQTHLMRISGIGEVTAQSIITHRQNIQPFTSLNQLCDIRGIGEKKLQAIVEDICLNPSKINKNPNPFHSPIQPNPRQFIRPNSLRIPPSPTKLSLNKAGKEALTQISGIGEKTAEHILTERTKRNGFQSWEEVAKINGIGESRLKLLQQHFSLPNSR